MFHLDCLYHRMYSNLSYMSYLLMKDLCNIQRPSKLKTKQLNRLPFSAVTTTASEAITTIKAVTTSEAVTTSKAVRAIKTVRTVKTAKEEAAAKS